MTKEEEPEKTPSSGIVTYEDGKKTIDFSIVAGITKIKFGFPEITTSLLTNRRPPEITRDLDLSKAFGEVSFEAPNTKATRDALWYIKDKDDLYKGGTLTITIFAKTELEETYTMELANMKNDIETTFNSASKFKVEFIGNKIKRKITGIKYE